jgi:hypothetical protein
MKISAHGLAMLALLALAGCRRESQPPSSFVASLRCGMTRSEVTQLAEKLGYNSSDKSWLSRAAAKPTMKNKDLSLVDLTFRDGKLAGYREGRAVAGSNRIEYHDVDLCKRAQ